MIYEAHYTIPFDVLFDSVIDEEGNYTKGLSELCEILNTKIDFDWLNTQYKNAEHGQGNVYVFWSSTKEEFIMRRI